MRGKHRWFMLFVALQLLFLLGMAGRHAYTLATGTPVLLKTAPVDPWDMFRGDYVVLSYEISLLPLPPAPHLLTGESVWVTLQPPVSGERHWQAVGVSRSRPAAAPGQVAVRGTVRWQDHTHLSVAYGIEQFYVPEGQGRELEQRMEQVDVVAVVDRFGRAALREVLVDGQPIVWK